MEKPSGLERGMGSVAVKAATTLLAATTLYAPLAALFVPILGDTLASGRYQKRIERAIRGLEVSLAEHGEKIESLTDAQFKFINETITTILQTLEDEKLSYLKCAVISCVSTPNMTHKEASVISRIIRDISADEIRLLASNSQFRGLVVSTGSDVETANYLGQNLAILQNTSDTETAVSGLISLGLLRLDDNVFGNTYSFTPIVEKLLALVGEPT